VRHSCARSAGAVEHFDTVIYSFHIEPCEIAANVPICSPHMEDEDLRILREAP
jgi:hypothetical protein